MGTALNLDGHNFSTGRDDSTGGVMSTFTYKGDPTVYQYQLLTEHYGLMALPYGPMLVNVHDPSMPVMLNENIGEIEHLLQFCKGDVLDIGANVGSFTVNFAQKAGHINAFEPHPQTYNNLCANLLLHQCKNVTTHQMALGSYNGDTFIEDFNTEEKHFSMGAYVGKGGIKVPMRTIDSFNFSPLNFIKIDVEGHEYEVLAGANFTLQRESPIVFVEIHVTELIDTIIKYMSDRGYHSREFISYYIHNDEGVKVPLTRGQLFWKEGRIVWAGEENND
jgi:FkbM family methyltransferase